MFKEYKLSDNSSIYIDKVNDKILVICKGSESPFYYSISLETILDEYCNEDSILIFDMLSCVSESSNRFYKLDFIKNEGRYRAKSGYNINKEDLDHDINKTIDEFYIIKGFEIYADSVLLDKKNTLLSTTSTNTTTDIKIDIEQMKQMLEETNVENEKLLTIYLYVLANKIEIPEDQFKQLEEYTKPILKKRLESIPYIHYPEPTYYLIDHFKFYPYR